MLCLCLFCTLIIVCHVFLDINYFIRALLTILSCIISKLLSGRCSLTDTTTVYGMCTLQDCNITFKETRLCRIIRDLDFARFHYYLRTGVWRQSQRLNIKSLQGCTFTVALDNIPIFTPYKINTKLACWDSRSLFFEHEVITLFDGKVRAILISRQFAISKTIGEDNCNTTEDLLRGLRGSETKPAVPESIEKWMKSMDVSSTKLRAENAAAPSYENK